MSIIDDFHHDDYGEGMPEIVIGGSIIVLVVVIGIIWLIIKVV